jgi:hypothetical protein
MSYVLGACFGVAMLESRYRDQVVQNFESFLRLPNYFNMLTKWCPEKLLALVEDAMKTERKSVETAKTKWEKEKRLMDQLIAHCKTVSAFS